MIINNINYYYRYTNVQRFRSTTLKSSESTTLPEDIKIKEEISDTINLTTSSIIEETIVSESPIIFSTEIPTSSTTNSTEQLSITSETTPSTRSTTISTSQQPTTESSVTLNDNFVTDVPLTTQSIPSSSKSIPTTVKTTAVSQPRPFGFSRRGRPTTATSSITVPSSTEQSRAKVSTRPTRNFVRTRTRHRSTESTELNPTTEVIETTKPTNKSRSTANRRGSSRYNSPTPRSTTLEANNNYQLRNPTRIATNFTGTTDATVESSEVKKSSVNRRRGRPTTLAPVHAPEKNKRRRQSTRSSVDQVTDSVIIRISRTELDPIENLKHSRSNFNDHTNYFSDNITNIKILEISDERHDSLNSIDATTIESLTWKPLLTTPEPTATVTDDITVTPNTLPTDFDTDVYSTTLLPSAVPMTKEEQEPVRKKVLLRRRPVTAVNTSTTTEHTNINQGRRRTVIRRRGPTSLNSVSDNEENKLITTTDSSIQLTTIEDNIKSTSFIDTAEITSTVDYTNLPFTIDSTENDVNTIPTLFTTEQDTLSTNTVHPRVYYSPETPIIITTTTHKSTTGSKTGPRFLRRKFIRKGPLGTSSTTPSSTTSSRRFGYSKFSQSSTPASLKNLSTNRRKSLFIRRRPVTTTTVNVDEQFDNDNYPTSIGFNDDITNPSVSRDVANFWKNYKSSATTLSPITSFDESSVADDSAPQESAEELGDIIADRQSRTNFQRNNDEKTIFKLPISKKDESIFGPNGSWYSQNLNTRSYPRRSSTTTESSVTETLIPAKKFDFIADAIQRRQQSQKNTHKSFGNDENSLEEDHSSTTPVTKPQVTRLVTSVVESGTTERQIILIKTKYSSLTSMTKIPADNSHNLHEQFGLQLEKNNIYADESRHVLLNLIRGTTERVPEKSTLPIESEFVRKPRYYFTTESTPESSTIAIESVFNNLISKGQRQ